MANGRSKYIEVTDVDTRNPLIVSISVRSLTPLGIENVKKALLKDGVTQASMERNTTSWCNTSSLFSFKFSRDTGDYIPPTDTPNRVNRGNWLVKSLGEEALLKLSRIAKDFVVRENQPEIDDALDELFDLACRTPLAWQKIIKSGELMKHTDKRKRHADVDADAAVAVEDDQPPRFLNEEGGIDADTLAARIVHHVKAVIKDMAEIIAQQVSALITHEFRGKTS